jgi:protoheme IX farnesyltransferase
MKDEYAKAGVPMMPVARGEDETRKQIVLYTGLLFLVTQLPVCGGLLGAFYMVVAAVLSAAFGVGAVALQRSRERRPALRLYLFSLAYLALLFGAMVIDARLFTPIV